LAGRRTRLERVRCPNPLREGSRVKGNGLRRAASGLRRDYVCTPKVGSRHKFVVLINAEEDEAVPLYAPPPPDNRTSPRTAR
jgi:hypothetical protein